MCYPIQTCNVFYCEGVACFKHLQRPLPPMCPKSCWRVITASGDLFPHWLQTAGRGQASLVADLLRGIQTVDHLPAFASVKVIDDCFGVPRFVTASRSIVSSWSNFVCFQTLFWHCLCWYKHHLHVFFICADNHAVLPAPYFLLFAVGINLSTFALDSCKV